MISLMADQFLCLISETLTEISREAVGKLLRRANKVGASKKKNKVGPPNLLLVHNLCGSVLLDFW